MSAFKIDLTDTPTSFLLLMLIDSRLLREQLTLREAVVTRQSSLTRAYNELRAEIDRRIPIPGRQR